MNFATAAIVVVISYAAGTAATRLADSVPIVLILAAIVVLLARRLDTLEQRDPCDPDEILPPTTDPEDTA